MKTIWILIFLLCGFMKTSYGKVDNDNYLNNNTKSSKIKKLSLEKRAKFKQKIGEEIKLKGNKYKLNNAPFRITIGQYDMALIFRSIFLEDQIETLAQKGCCLCIRFGVNNLGRIEYLSFLFPKCALPILDIISVDQWSKLEELLISKVRLRQWNDVKYGSKYLDYIDIYSFEDIKNGKFRNETIE